MGTSDPKLKQTGIYRNFFISLIDKRWPTYSDRAYLDSTILSQIVPIAKGNLAGIAAIWMSDSFLLPSID